MDGLAALRDEWLSDAELVARLSTLSLRTLDQNGVWTQRTTAARLWWLASQTLVPDGPTLYVSQLSRALMIRVAGLVTVTPELLACRRFLDGGRALTS